MRRSAKSAEGGKKGKNDAESGGKVIFCTLGPAGTQISYPFNVPLIHDVQIRAHLGGEIN